MWSSSRCADEQGGELHTDDIESGDEADSNLDVEDCLPDHHAKEQDRAAHLRDRHGATAELVRRRRHKRKTGDKTKEMYKPFVKPILKAHFVPDPEFITP